MEKLRLTFLEGTGFSQNLDPLEETLHEFGKIICDYSKGYFIYIVTTTQYNDTVREASLYLIMPEINYDYKILTLSYKNPQTITIHFFTFKTHQIETLTASTSNQFTEVKDKVITILNSPLADTTFRFLVDQVNLKRNARG